MVQGLIKYNPTPLTRFTQIMLTYLNLGITIICIEPHPMTDLLKWSLFNLNLVCSTWGYVVYLYRFHLLSSVFASSPFAHTSLTACQDILKSSLSVRIWKVFSCWLSKHPPQLCCCVQVSVYIPVIYAAIYYIYWGLYPLYVIFWRAHRVLENTCVVIEKHITCWFWLTFAV